jgi:pre-mRNA-processing factor 6
MGMESAAPEAPGASGRGGDRGATRDREAVPGQYDDDDDEADRIWEAVEERMKQRRRKKTRLEDAEGADGSNVNGTKIASQFRELKQGLSKVSEDEWANLPDVGDYSLKYKQKRQQTHEIFTPLTDDMLVRQSEQNRSAPSGTADASGTQTAVQDMSGLSAARGTVLGMSLDKMTTKGGDTTDGASTLATETVDKEGYLTSLATSTAASAATANVADLQKARLLLQSVRSTNPKHAAGWIAAARVEEAAQKLLQARKIIQQATTVCPHATDVWLEAARLHPPEVGKSILATAVRHLPHAVPLFLKAADLEVHSEAKKAVLRKALQANPTSVTLWKTAIDLEDSDADAKVLLEVAVENVPQAVDLWMAWAKLEDYKQAQKVLNRARKAVPTDRSIWMAAAQLEEGQHHDPSRIVQRAVQSLRQHEAVVTRAQWLTQAEQSETVGCPLTAAAIVQETIGQDVEDPDRLRTWTTDVKACLERTKVDTARAILQHALSFFPRKPQLWKQSVMLEKQNGSAESLDQVLAQACERLPQVEFFWLLRAKELWLRGEVNEARNVLAQAFEANPETEGVWLAAAKLEWENQEAERARVLLQRARSRAPTRRVYMKAVLLEREEKETQTALLLLQEGIGKYPDFAKFYMMGGQIYSEDLPKNKASLEKARKFYQRGLQACPKNATIWILASRLEEKAAEFVPEDAFVAKMASTKARSLLELARLKNAQVAELWLESIRLEARVGHTKLAGTLVARALQDCPKSGKLWAEQLRMASRAEQKRKAADAIQRCPEDVHVITAVASLFGQDGKDAKARKWFNRAVQVDKDHGDSWACYYAYLTKQEDTEQMEMVKAQCAAAEPKHGELWTSVSKSMQHRHKSTAEHLTLSAQLVVSKTR